MLVDGGVKGWRVEKKKKQLLSNRRLLATDDLMRKHCQLINVDVDVDDSSALTLKYHNNFP